MLKTRLIFLVVGLGLASLASSALRSRGVEANPGAALQTTLAQPQPSQLHSNQPHPNQSTAMSLEQAVAMVQARYGARAVRSNTVQEDGRVVHYIRLVSADRSRVWTVRVDAATGQEF
jgi:uncharacterized membrane protein YkoI